jgi:hypothetical protein
MITDQKLMFVKHSRFRGEGLPSATIGENKFLRFSAPKPPRYLIADRGGSVLVKPCGERKANRLTRFRSGIARKFCRTYQLITSCGATRYDWDGQSVPVAAEAETTKARRDNQRRAGFCIVVSSSLARTYQRSGPVRPCL